MIKLTKPPKEVCRGDLPALERRGYVAQELAGRDFIFVTLHATGMDLHGASGLPVIMDNGLVKIKSDIEDTVLLGTSADNRVVALVDILMLGRNSQRRRPWIDRLSVLSAVYSRLPVEAKGCLMLARQWESGMIRAFDTVKKGGGAGLFLRARGMTDAIICV